VHPAGCDIVRGQQRAWHLRGPGPTVLPEGSAGGAQCPVAAAQGYWRGVRGAPTSGSRPPDHTHAHKIARAKTG